MRKIVYIASLILFLVSGCITAPPTIVAFSFNPTTITAGASTTVIWAVTDADSVKIDPGIGAVAPVGSLIVSPSTTTTYTLTASNVGGTVIATALLTVNSTPPPVVTLFNINPSTITVGQPANVTWNVTGATSVRIDPAIGTGAASGIQTVSPTTTTTYTLTASNGGGTITSAATLTVNPQNPTPVVQDFGVSPSTIFAGQVATLHWNVAGATSIFIDQGIGSVPAIGSQQVSPFYTTTYVLTSCDNMCTITATATLEVSSGYTPPYGIPSPSPYGNLPLIVLFDINPPVISLGNSATMEWSVDGATSVSIDQGIGPVAPSGSLTISPAASNFYTLTAINGAGSVTSSATIIVSPPAVLPPVIVSFTATPNSILTGQSSTLQWNVTGATSVSIDHGIGAVATTGATSVSPTATTAYTLTATNSAGSVSGSATVTVNPSPVLPPVIVSFIATPNSILTGQSSTLQWNVTGATSVSIDHGIGTVAVTGATSVSPATTTVYALTATNSAGSITASATITVTAPPNLSPPVIVSFFANPTNLGQDLGLPATLNWSVTGATSIYIDGIGSVPASGSSVVRPRHTTVYTLTASNSAGVVMHTVQIRVN
jgi:hypothetical protein